MTNSKRQRSSASRKRASTSTQQPSTSRQQPSASTQQPSASTQRSGTGTQAPSTSTQPPTATPTPAPPPVPGTYPAAVRRINASYAQPLAGAERQLESMHKHAAHRIADLAEAEHGMALARDRVYAAERRLRDAQDLVVGAEERLAGIRELQRVELEYVAKAHGAVVPKGEVPAEEVTQAGEGVVDRRRTI
ncbi:hypothetical protein Q8F55_001551 [Vanrija albida]|uniref:Biogenesis of lysosome-related organelles complex 1 subunit 1 n=1 Tax=Vanrija albida TaxID=181172 RepID=A0ABR3QGE0_9TREE